MPKPVKQKKPIAPKRPTDPNQLARQLVEESTRDPDPVELVPPMLDFKTQLSEYMAKLGAKGGKIGGKRRMDSMIEAEKSALGLKAATARWNKERARRKRGEK